MLLANFENVLTAYRYPREVLLHYILSFYFGTNFICVFVVDLQLSSSERTAFDKLAERSLNSISTEEKHLEPRYLCVDLKDNIR